MIPRTWNTLLATLSQSRSFGNEVVRRVRLAKRHHETVTNELQSRRVRFIKRESQRELSILRARAPHTVARPDSELEMTEQGHVILDPTSEPSPHGGMYSLINTYR